MNATKIYPSLPHKSTKYTIDRYRHNGYLFQLDSNRKYIVMATCASSQKSSDTIILEPKARMQAESKNLADT